MKKYIPFLIITSLLLSACSIDWNDSKDKKISELEKQIQDNNLKKDIECRDYFEKNKSRIYGEKLEKEMNVLHIFYGKKSNSCYFAYSIMHENPNKGEYFIDNLLQEDSIFETGIIDGDSLDLRLAVNRVLEKIKELKGE